MTHEDRSAHKVVVFGATGPTGQRIVSLALEEGYRIVAAARHPAAAWIERPEVEAASAADAATGKHWREVIETDLTSTLLTVSAFLPAMIARHSGVIITMSSAAARQAAKSSAAYAASKIML